MAEFKISRVQEFGDEAGTGGAGGGPACCDQEHGGPSYKPMETQSRREKLPGLFHRLVRSRWKSLSSREKVLEANHLLSHQVYQRSLEHIDGS